MLSRFNAARRALAVGLAFLLCALLVPAKTAAEACQSYTVNVTVDASGNATAYTSAVLNGRVLTVIYTADGTSPFDNTVDFTITGETSGQNVWTESNLTASKTVAPRQATHSTAGVASLYAAGGTAVQDYVWLATERVKIVIAQGGNAKTGRLVFIVG